MEWKDKPTTDGYYWVMDGGEETLVRYEGNFNGRYTVTEFDGNYAKNTDDYSEWFGPLPVPARPVVVILEHGFANGV